MDHTDFCVIGNGAVGMLTAVELTKNYPDKKITLIGPFSQKGSASVAAGAMHAVFGEIEAHFEDSLGDQKQFELGFKSKEYWDNYFSMFGNDAKTAEDTLIYLKDTKNPFEVANYKKATDIAESYGLLKNPDKHHVEEYLNLTSLEAVNIIKGEFAICPVTFFEQVTNFLRKSPMIELINDKVVSLDKNIATISSGSKINSKIYVICNGAAASSLLSDYKLLPIYQGVGSALTVNSETLDFGSELVVRTVNRGGAQCGVHLVPRANGTHYIGAGNYLAPFDERDDHRFETIRYLINTVEEDIIGKKNTYSFRGSLLMGKRPRSFDGWPIFGPLRSNPNIIVASGWNRIGFSLAPLIANEIVGIIKDDKIRHINDWLPDRKPISFGTKKECADFFATSRCANLIEHKLLDPSSEEYNKKYDELYSYSAKANYTLTKKLGMDSDFGIHPDLYGIL